MCTQGSYFCTMYPYVHTCVHLKIWKQVPLNADSSDLRGVDLAAGAPGTRDCDLLTDVFARLFKFSLANKYGLCKWV